MKTNSRRKKMMGRRDVQEMERTGWYFHTISGTGHMIFRHPTIRKQIVVSMSPNDPRAESNGLALVRRYNAEAAA